MKLSYQYFLLLDYKLKRSVEVFLFKVYVNSRDVAKAMAQIHVSFPRDDNEAKRSKKTWESVFSKTSYDESVIMGGAQEEESVIFLSIFLYLLLHRVKKSPRTHKRDQYLGRTHKRDHYLGRTHKRDQYLGRTYKRD